MSSSLEKYFLYAYILSLPLVGVFCINEKIRIPLVLGMIIILFNFLKIKYDFGDFIFLLLGICFMTSMLLNNINKSSIFYIIGFMTSYFIYEKSLSIYYFKYKNSILKCIYYSSIILYIFIIYEFVTKNFYPSMFFDLPRVYKINYNSTFLGRYIRARGFMEESGHAALFIEFCLPLSIYYIKKNKLNYIIYALLCILALAFINSAASIMLLFISFVILFVYNFNFKFTYNKLIKWIIGFMFCGSGMIILLIYFPQIKDGIYALVMKALYITRDHDNSILDRTYRLNSSFNVLKDNIILGVGPQNLRYYTNIDSSLNLFLDIWLFSGIFGLSVFIIYLITIAKKLFSIKSDLKIYLICCFFMMIAHYQIVNNFWYPWIWILFAIVKCEYK